MSNDKKQPEKKEKETVINVQMTAYKSKLSFDAKEALTENRTFLSITVEPGATKEETAANYAAAVKRAKMKFKQLKKAELPEGAWLEVVKVVDGEEVEQLFS